MAPLTLRVLRPFQVKFDGGSVSGFASAKVPALLACLALPTKWLHHRKQRPASPCLLPPGGNPATLPQQTTPARPLAPWRALCYTDHRLGLGQSREVILPCYAPTPSRL